MKIYDSTAHTLSSRRRARLQTLTWSVLAAHKIDRSQPVDLLHLALRLGYRIVPTGVPGGMEVGPIGEGDQGAIFVWPDYEAVEEFRFVLAHEIGHAILRTRDPRHGEAAADFVAEVLVKAAAPTLSRNAISSADSVRREL